LNPIYEYRFDLSPFYCKTKASNMLLFYYNISPELAPPCIWRFSLQ
jgi:hypothetical protein